MTKTTPALIQSIGIFFLITVTLTGTCYLLGNHMVGYLNSNNGIYEREGNVNVTYLQGEACTVNMTKDVSVAEINSNFIWCMEQHLNHLAQEKK